ncbi:MAG: competence protein ComEA [Firmicutes bacterium HGW-Firmicutes-12]|jgi:competence protein ComEA|nr:MAG: competence protein ComEA [Firmicutes bacterium HGW-Firmicutes-12]
MFTGITDRRQIIAISILLGVIFFFGGVKYYEMRLDKVEVITEFTVEQEKEIEAEKTLEETPALFAVHVVGSVEKPGVYLLEENKRVNDAVKLAVPTDKADLTQLNLAVLLEDGKQIYVPAQGENTSPSEALVRLGQQSSGLVNINTAAVGELDTLPGIGPALAGRIIDYRKKNGAFSSIEDITKVSGIGPSLLENIRNMVTVR